MVKLTSITLCVILLVSYMANAESLEEFLDGDGAALGVELAPEDLTVYDFSEPDRELPPGSAGNDAVPKSIISYDAEAVVDMAFFNENGYVEKKLEGNLTMEATLKNTSSAQKSFTPIFAVYDAGGKLRHVKTGEAATAPASSSETAAVTLNTAQAASTDSVKAMVWDMASLRPYTAAQAVPRNAADFYGNSFETSTYVNDISKQISGAIDTGGDTDFIRFTAPGKGPYTFQCLSSGGIFATLYDSMQHTMEINFTSISCNLASGVTFYLKVGKTSGTGGYLLSIKPTGQVQTFDVYQFDIDTNAHKEEILSICNDLYDTNKEASKKMYNDYEKVLAKDAKLHELPEFLAGHPKEVSNFDALLNQYYAPKHDDFMDVKQQYADILAGYDGEDGYYNPGHVGSPSGGMAAPYKTDPESLENPPQELQSEARAAASFVITSATSSSITYSVTFPSSGALGNTISLIDFNTNNGLTLNDSIHKKSDGSRDVNRRNGIYTVSDLKAGGYYVLQMMWSMDGGKTYGGENSIYRRIQLPYNSAESKVLYSGTHVTARLEAFDKSLASNTSFNRWLSRMDTAYNKFKELTGYTPYGGRKIELNSSREDLSETAGMPDGENHWEIIYGWSGNPVTFGQPHLRGFMRRLSLGDWGDLPLHELSHDFDNADWEFDAEALSFFKMYYVIEQLNAEVYRSDVAAYHDGDGNFQNAWYTGSEYYPFLRDDYYKGYKAYFDKGKYSGGGLATILIELKNIIGWEPVKKTFRYFSSLNASQAPRNNGEKLKLFLTKLKDYSGRDVLNYISNRDERIIEDHFGIDLQYVDPVYPDAGGGGGSSGERPEINIPGGKYITYQFTPANSAVYYIYTSPYAGSGVSNDTYLEVYTDASLTGTPIASNDDYGGSRFSKVSVSMTEGITYYIKVRHYSNGQIHAQLNITKNVPVQPLTLDVRENIITANGEYAMFSFTPDCTQMYTFDVENYSGGTSAYDTYIKLYENESMTKRIGQDSSKIIASLSAGQTYYLQFSGFMMKYARGCVGVKRAQTLEFTKRTDSNFIYVNNPEYITKYDIVDDEEIEINQTKRNKIFEQNVSGRNTYYQTHISWYNNPDGYNDHFPKNGFYLDVDFYNPSSSTVTVIIENLAKSNYYNDLQRYFGTGDNFHLTLNPGQHKRLLSNENYNSPLFVTFSTANMAILFEFTVSDYSNIVISSLAAYNQTNLVMRNGTKNMLENGIELNNGDMIHQDRPYVKDNNIVRPGEDDLYGKYKGIAKNQSAWVDSNLEFVIDNSTPGGQALPVFVRDQNYPNGVANPKYMWITHLNPISDGYDMGVLNTMPSVLHKFTYRFMSDQEWNFDFEHRNAKFDNMTIDYENLGLSVNNPVPKSILEQVALDVAKGEKSYYPNSSGHNGGGNPPDPEALGMAAWGTTYHYTITIDNRGTDRTAAFRIRNSSNVIFGLKKAGQTYYETDIYSMGGGENDWREVTVSVPENTITTFEVVTLPCGGNAGLNNQLVLY